MTVLTQVAFAEEVARWEHQHGSLGVKWVFLDVGAISRQAKQRFGALGLYLHYMSWQRQAYLRARALCAEDSFDVVHHLTMNGFRVPGHLWRLPVPFVWGPIGGFQDADRTLMAVQGLSVGTVRERVRSLLNRRSRWARLPRACASRAAVVVGANQDSMAWLRSVPVRGEVLQCLEAGIDVVNSRVRSLPARARRILWVGSGACYKNPEFALLAFAVVRKAAGPSWSLMMVGVSSDRERELRRWAKKRSMGLEGVEITGKVEKEALPDLYDSAHQFWFTSYRDTSGNVLLEAMACGTPCLAFDHQGASAILENGGGALVGVVELRTTIKRWAAEALLLIKNDEVWAAASQAACDSIVNRQRWVHRVNRVYQCVEAVLGRSK
ncbi:MAG: glycosyltransferase [Planctomycetota bacterium]|nr:glycosyltransferase [Planctomycetota bacterium]